MTEHRETIPFTREMAVQALKGILEETGATDDEEAQEDAATLVDRCIELGRYEKRKDNEIQQQGQLVEGLTTMLEMRLQKRRRSVHQDVAFCRSSCCGARWRVGSWEHLFRRLYFLRRSSA